MIKWCFTDLDGMGLKEGYHAINGGDPRGLCGGRLLASGSEVTESLPATWESACSSANSAASISLQLKWSSAGERVFHQEAGLGQ